jgi:hypothetical protein
MLTLHQIIVRVIKLRLMRWAEHIKNHGGENSTPSEKLKSSDRMWEDYIEIDRVEIEFNDVGLIELAQDRVE